MIFGLLAEFERPAELVEAARRAYAAGYRRIDAFTPYPVHELDEALHLPRTRLPAIVFAGGLAGCVGGYLLQVYAMAIDYPLNIAGRPLHSWPAFIPVTFECTILGAALTAVLGMLAMNGLPEPYHPAFNVPAFALASRDRFFLCIEASDPRFDRTETAAFLRGLEPRGVHEIAP